MDGLRRRVRADASLFSLLAARARKLWLRVGGGSPRMPRAEQRRRCSYRSIDRILCILVLSLGSCAFRAIELVEKMGLQPPRFFPSRHRQVTLCYGL